MNGIRQPLGSTHGWTRTALITGLLGLVGCAAPTEQSTQLEPAPELTSSNSTQPNNTQPDSDHEPITLSEARLKELRQTAVPNPRSPEALASGLIGARLDQLPWTSANWSQPRRVVVGEQTRHWTVTLPLSMTPAACGKETFELPLPELAQGLTRIGVWTEQDPRQAARDQARWAQAKLSSAQQAALCLQVSRVWRQELEQALGASPTPPQP